MSEMIKNTLLSIITDTILIIIVVTIIARQEEEAECDRHEFIAVSYTAPALALDEDENDDVDLDYSNDVVSTFEHCCHHHVADELISFLYSHLSFFTLPEPCDFSWQTKHSACLVIYGLWKTVSSSSSYSLSTRNRAQYCESESCISRGTRSHSQ